jgi:hypothetical protein
MLPNLQPQMSPTIGRCLSKHKGDRYELGGLTSLSNEAAEILSRHKGELWLNGLKSLSDAAAESLSRHKGEVLSLNGLTSVSDEVAESLSKHRGFLCLEGLKTLPEDAIKRFHDYRGHLDVPSMALNDRQLELLSLCKCRNSVFLPNCEHIEWQWQGVATPSGLQTNWNSKGKRINVPKYFAHKSPLGFKKRPLPVTCLEMYNRVGFQSQTLREDEVRTLITCRGFIDIDVLHITDAVADVLSTHEGGLAIECQRITDYAADCLARTKGPLVTNLVGANSVMSEHAASKLSCHHDYVSLGRERDLVYAIRGRDGKS